MIGKTLKNAIYAKFHKKTTKREFRRCKIFCNCFINLDNVPISGIIADMNGEIFRKSYQLVCLNNETFE